MDVLLLVQVTEQQDYVIVGVGLVRDYDDDDADDDNNDDDDDYDEYYHYYYYG